MPTRLVRPGSSGLQTLADAYPDGMIGVDSEGVIVVINTQARSLLSVGPDVEALGTPVSGILQLQDQEGRSWLDVNRPYDTLSTVRGVPEQSWLNSRGEEVLTTARLVRERHLGPVTGMAIALRSGRGRARLDRERSDLVATVAHELRSPLTGVKGFVQALLNRWDKLSDDQRKLMLTTVNADADRLTRLIAELLDVARIDTGRLQLYPREVPAAVLVGRVVDSVAHSTSREIHLHVDPATPEVFADPDKFTQVVTNVLENAVRHGDGRVDVSVAPHDAGWPAVRVAVEDEGEGIPEEIRNRVFTKFWTLGRGGSGLGMYIVGGLTRAHGGVITISDASSGGARVAIDWPQQDRRPD